MGRNDEALVRYFADNNRYADLINGFVLNGQQIIKAEDLRPTDSRIHEKEKNKKSKYRDLIRSTAFGANFAIIGVENQAEVHYGVSLLSLIARPPKVFAPQPLISLLLQVLPSS